MGNPTDAIREAVRVELARRRMTQSDLAEQLGTSRQHLSKAMTGGSSELPKLWRDALEYLGLELVARPKPEPLDEESRGWLEGDLSRLGDFPYDWGELDPETVGEPLRWDTERGWVND